ncbi:MAG: DUF192 domain-containing protein [Ignavibacteriales bacterium]|nr:DUF192 domain-containing protein [Ignavibacteriales bacterium]
MKKQNNKSKNVTNSQQKVVRGNIFIKIGIAVLIVAVVVVFVVPGLTDRSYKNETNEPGGGYVYKRGNVAILDSLGKERVKIDAEFADTEYDRQRGLMFRKTMQEGQGMLFIFPVEEMQSFWMRNTYIPLDILFIDANKKIVTIHKNTKTLSDQSYPSTAPSKMFLKWLVGFVETWC